MEKYYSEARAGIEPAHRCFADTRVSTSPSRQLCLSYHEFEFKKTIIRKLYLIV